MPITLESRLEGIENELKEIKRKIYISDSKRKFFRAAGAWSKVDTEKLKKDIYESRSMIRKEKVEF